VHWPNPSDLGARAIGQPSEIHAALRKSESQLMVGRSDGVAAMLADLMHFHGKPLEAF
jgi:hypothetical protein